MPPVGLSFSSKKKTASLSDTCPYQFKLKEVSGRAMFIVPTERKHISSKKSMPDNFIFISESYTVGSFEGIYLIYIISYYNKDYFWACIPFFWIDLNDSFFTADPVFACYLKEKILFNFKNLSGRGNNDLAIKILLTQSLCDKR